MNPKDNNPENQITKQDFDFIVNQQETPKLKKKISKKTIILIILGILLIIMLGVILLSPNSSNDSNQPTNVGNNSSESTTPEQIVKNYFKNLNDKNYKEAFKQLDTSLTNPNIETSFVEKTGPFLNDIYDFNTCGQINITNTEQEFKAETTCTSKEDSEQVQLKITLVNTKEGVKISKLEEVVNEV